MGYSWSPAIEAKSRISPNFDGRTVYFWRAAFAPFPFPSEVRALHCSITGISMATDLDVAGVGNTARDSDFIVPRALQGWDSVRRSPQTPQAPGPDEAVPMSQGWQPLPCPRRSLSFWASLPGAVPLALFKRAEVFLSAVLPTFLCRCLLY